MGGGGGMNWAIGSDMYTLMCIKWMTNKNKKKSREDVRTNYRLRENILNP